MKTYRVFYRKYKIFRILMFFLIFLIIMVALMENILKALVNNYPAFDWGVGIMFLVSLVFNIFMVAAIYDTIKLLFITKPIFILNEEGFHLGAPYHVTVLWEHYKDLRKHYKRRQGSSRTYLSIIYLDIEHIDYYLDYNPNEKVKTLMNNYMSAHNTPFVMTSDYLSDDLEYIVTQIESYHEAYTEKKQEEKEAEQEHKAI